MDTAFIHQAGHGPAGHAESKLGDQDVQPISMYCMAHGCTYINVGIKTQA